MWRDGQIAYVLSHLDAGHRTGPALTVTRGGSPILAAIDEVFADHRIVDTEGDPLPSRLREQSRRPFREDTPILSGDDLGPAATFKVIVVPDPTVWSGPIRSLLDRLAEFRGRLEAGGVLVFGLDVAVGRHANLDFPGIELIAHPGFRAALRDAMGLSPWGEPELSVDPSTLSHLTDSRSDRSSSRDRLDAHAETTLPFVWCLRADDGNRSVDAMAANAWHALCRDCLTGLGQAGPGVRVEAGAITVAGALAAQGQFGRILTVAGVAASHPQAILRFTIEAPDIDATGGCLRVLASETGSARRCEFLVDVSAPGRTAIELAADGAVDWSAGVDLQVHAEDLGPVTLDSFRLE